MSFPHAALLRKKLQSCNWTHPTWEQPNVHASFLSEYPSCKTHRLSILGTLATLRSFWVWGLATEMSFRSDLTPWHPMCTARLQNLNLLYEEGTERGGSEVTELHRTLWVATGRFGCAWSASRMFSERESVYLSCKQHWCRLGTANILNQIVEVILAHPYVLKPIWEHLAPTSANVPRSLNRPTTSSFFRSLLAHTPQTEFQLELHRCLKNIKQ